MTPAAPPAPRCRHCGRMARPMGRGLCTPCFMTPAVRPLYPKLDRRPTAPKDARAMKKVFTTGQVAKICQVAARTVSKWFDSGKLKGYRIPGSQDRRIPREQLIRFLIDHGMPLGELEAEEQWRVLFVGVAAGTRAVVCDALPAADGFRFETAGNGFDAGSLAQSFKPDAVVVGFSVGRADAQVIAAGLRRSDLFAHALIVGLAGEDEADAEGVKAAGFDAVLVAPHDPAAVAAMIRGRAERVRADE